MARASLLGCMLAGPGHEGLCHVPGAATAVRACLVSLGPRVGGSASLGWSTCDSGQTCRKSSGEGYRGGCAAVATADGVEVVNGNAADQQWH